MKKEKNSISANTACDDLQTKVSETVVTVANNVNAQPEAVKNLSWKEIEVSSKEALVEKMREDAKPVKSIKKIYIDDDGDIAIQVAPIPVSRYDSYCVPRITQNQCYWLEARVQGCVEWINAYAASKIIGMMKKYDIARKAIYVFQ